MRLLQFLREKCEGAPSVKAIKRAIDGKACTVNDRIETFSSYPLKADDVVVLDKSALTPQKSFKIPILYEDKDLCIVNKPAGLVSEHIVGELVHRLDKETSGVLILAKTAKAKQKMIALFKEREVRKLYLAIVDGHVDKDSGKIDNYLGKKHAFQGQTVYGSVGEKKGLRAITFWKVLRRGKTASLLSCEPLTGRTHQLRVHLSEMGHPILGDIQYGKKFHCPFKPQRNLLHAYSVVFVLPSTGKELKVTAPIPVDFKRALIFLKVSLDGACD